MNIFKKLLHRSIKIFGSSKCKQNIWNVEFKNRIWDNLNYTKSDIVYSYIEKYIKNGAILDLGSGSGNTGIELNCNAYMEYVGVDISSEAINMAKEKNNLLFERKSKNSYYVEDIVKYIPSRKFDVILFRESIYYIRPNLIIPTIDRQLKYLNNQGVVIVRMHDKKKYNNIVDKIINNYNILDKYDVINKRTIILVFN